VEDYAIFMLDVDGRVGTWSPGAEKIKGYTAEEIIGCHISKFYTKEDLELDKPAQILRIASERGRAEEQGYRVRKDGSRFWANVTVTALCDETGRLRGFGKVTRDLSARQEAEEQLRQAEARFHHLVDAVIDYAIFMLDENGHVSTWNSGARRLKGYSAEEIIGKHFSQFYTEEDRASGKPDRVLAAVRSEGRYEEEGFRVRKDGTRFWANVVLTALYGEGNKVVGFAKVTRDLTKRREAEETERRLFKEQTARELAELAERRVRESEERYRALSQRLEIVFEGVADGITVQNRSGRVVFANRAAARLCGLESGSDLMTPSQAELGRRFELLDEEGRPVALEDLPGRRVLAGARSASALVHLRDRSSRKERWVSMRATAVVSPSGEHDLSVNIWHDVSVEHRERRQARLLADATEALGRSLDQREMLVGLGRVLVPALADFAAIDVVDGAELERLATIPEELDAAFPARDSREHREVWASVRAGACEIRDAHVHVPIRARDRVLGMLSLGSRDYHDSYDTSEIALVEELGRRAGVALENAELYASAQHAARAAEEASRAKDEFLATVSHELRTPLNAILGWSALLKDRAVDSTLSKPLEVINRNALTQVKIIDDILDVSRVITGKFRLEPRPADLVAITRDAIEVVRPSAIAKRVDLELVSNEPSFTLVADPDRLQQVVWNLLSNAVKFTDSGGKIRIDIEQQGSIGVLSVSDTGIGLDPDFLPHVFERFKQADSKRTRRIGGLGLGLALVRHIVELHGGSVSVTSEGLGKGACFTVKLPIRAVLPEGELLAQPPSSKDRRERSMLEGVRVLVVDDEPDARELVATVLNQAGAVVETARSAAEAYVAFRDFHPDVLVSDIGMPDEDGFSLMRRIRELPASDGGHVPSLALTAFAREEDRARSLRAGYTTHVGKPVNPNALTMAVANLSLVNREH
jgi:PAS domain S-box-containing protein